MKKSQLLGLVFCSLMQTTPAFSSTTTINFDNLADGTLVTTLDGVTFSSSVTPDFGLNLVVSNVFDTTSGDNYLGVGDGGTEIFLPGDTIDMSFSIPITSLSVSFISTADAPPNAYSITSSVGSVSNGNAPDLTLPDTGEVFILLLTSATPFTSAQLYGGNGGVHSYSIDDIVFTTVPVPPALLLFVSGLLALGGLRKTRVA